MPRYSITRRHQWAGLWPRLATSTPELKSASIAPFGRPVIAACAAIDDGQAGRVGAQGRRLDRGRAPADVVRVLFAAMFDGAVDADSEA